MYKHLAGPTVTVVFISNVRGWDPTIKFAIYLTNIIKHILNTYLHASGESFIFNHTSIRGIGLCVFTRFTKTNIPTKKNNNNFAAANTLNCPRVYCKLCILQQACQSEKTMVIQSHVTNRSCNSALIAAVACSRRMSVYATE